MATALLFPGQGAQVVGMGAQITSRSKLARTLFDDASDILGFNLLQLCLDGPAEELNRTEFSQPALFVHSMAVLKELESQQPDLWTSVAAVAGLSLGEYTAVAAAGGISFADGVRLVHARGRAMQAAADAMPSGMSSVMGVDSLQLEQICQQASQSPSDFVVPANLLCPGNIAISGHVTALSRAEQLAMEKGAMKCLRLPVAGAFHTLIMQSAVELLIEALSTVQFSDTTIPIISNVDAQAHTKASEFRQLLPQQVVAPVLWEKSLHALIGMGVDQFYEVGAGRVLVGTVKRVDRKKNCQSFGD